MNITFAPEGWSDHVCWQGANPETVKRINELLKDIVRSPFVGIGKPEPLKPQWRGYWSRRVDLRHRLVYRITEDVVLIAQCRFHY